MLRHLPPLGAAFLVNACASQNTLNYKPEQFADITIGEKTYSCPVKLDTGARTTSLHAQNITVGKELISFSVVNQTVTAPRERSAKIKGEDNRRQVVKADITLGEFESVAIEVNLNDRSGMDRPLLIGRNFLAEHGIVVDSSKSQNLLSDSELVCTPKSE